VLFNVSSKKLLFQRIYVKSLKVLRILRRNFFKIVLGFMIFSISYWLVNDLFVERNLLADATNLMQQKNYKVATSRYKLALRYYQINHFTENTKHKYFDVSYKFSICLLKQNFKKEAIQNMLDTESQVRWDYGFYSKDYEYFLRNYLIDFYLQINNINLTKRTFKKIIAINKNLGCNYSEMADLMRVAGDIYFNEKDLKSALNFYNKAYTIITNQKIPDYLILMNITNKICANEVKLGLSDNAIELYENSIEITRQASKPQDLVLSQLLINLGDLYSQNDQTMIDSVNCYEEAIEITKTMPMNTFPRQNLQNYILKYKDLKAKNEFLQKLNKASAPK